MKRLTTLNQIKDATDNGLFLLYVAPHFDIDLNMLILKPLTWMAHTKLDGTRINVEVYSWVDDGSGISNPPYRTLMTFQEINNKLLQRTFQLDDDEINHHVLMSLI